MKEGIKGVFKIGETKKYYRVPKRGGAPLYK
jgi:hypothetical protein